MQGDVQNGEEIDLIGSFCVHARVALMAELELIQLALVFAMGFGESFSESFLHSQEM